MIDYWYMFPIAICFSSIAMMSGIGGASMFTPFFFLIMRLPASVAVGVGLFVEIFGFSSGLIGFGRKKLISYPVGFYFLSFTIPAAIIGAIMSHMIPEQAIMAVLSLILFTLSYFIMKPEHEVMVKHHSHHIRHKNYVEPKKKTLVNGLSFLGGWLAGLVSSGLGEMNDYVLLKKYKMKGSLAAGTSVFIVAITAMVGSLTHAYTFMTTGLDSYYYKIFSILIFTLPGVIIGAQLGVRLSQQVSDEMRKQFISFLFLCLGLITLTSVI